MSILPVVTDEKTLREPSLPWEFGDNLVTTQLAVDLTETMIDSGGVGFSAPQLGVKSRVFVIRAEPVIAFYNPVVVDFSEQESVEKEGCLSFPGLFVKVKRPLSVRVRFQKPDGTTDTMKFNGVTARIVQHEMDHLDGIIFFDRAHPLHREQAFNKWKAFKRRQK